MKFNTFTVDINITYQLLTNNHISGKYTIAIHSRDEECYGGKIHLKSVTIFLDNNGAGKTKPKQAFRLT